jgi:hypothetical protein
MKRLSTLLAVLALPAAADSPDASNASRAKVAAACTALVTTEGSVSVKVNPFGSQSCGAAIVTVTADRGSDRMRSLDKETLEAELTTAFTPAF